ncbi:PP2C-domain-containing protein [Rhizophagus irregularis]|uniref:protein-serine/threonine phosphatase n=1 Tax=Rhizophagus irregularis TaxID=588596 RepID=A0A2N0RW57_9GLOM|nr:PP2C-domain-containing protein [Rhizophagus irregularis]
MGQTLSEPVKEKHSDSGHDDRLLFASSAMQGWRISMEDAHTAELTLADKKGYSFFGVYDGHGGQNIAKYSGAHLHERIARDPAFPNNIEEAIKSGFLGTDEDLRNDSQYANDPSGCTAVTSIITPQNQVYVGNAGDSRAVISIDGIANPMSNDHKPVNKEESDRITKAGGFVEFGRVNGNLALSRAIGDFEFKQNPSLTPEHQIVTAYPDVRKEDITEKTEFLVLACDGIWDCLTSQQVVNFIRREISVHRNLQKACENLMERCLAKDSELGGIGCDNMTVIIVGFLDGKVVDDWYDWMALRYGKVGHEYEESDNRQQKGDDSEYNDDDSDEGLEIPADTSTEDYVTDDTDLENQNELTIDDIPTQHRRDSSSSFSSVESGNSSRSNSTDSVSKADNDKSETIDSPISNPPQSPHNSKSLTDDKTTINAPLSPGGKTKTYDSATWPSLPKKDQNRKQ